MFDVINIIDLECTCWEDKPYDPDMEIIEIGITGVDIKDLSIKYSEGHFVNPEYSEISEFCTKLTTITPETLKVNGAKSLKETFELLSDLYLIQTRPWASWGNFDREHIEKECVRKNIFYPVNKNHLNLSNLFALKFAQKRCSVEKALNRLNMTFEGTPHRGKDDTFNIAKLYKEVMIRPFKKK